MSVEDTAQWEFVDLVAEDTVKMVIAENMDMACLMVTFLVEELFLKVENRFAVLAAECLAVLDMAVLWGTVRSVVFAEDTD